MIEVINVTRKTIRTMSDVFTGSVLTDGVSVTRLPKVQTQLISSSNLDPIGKGRYRSSDLRHKLNGIDRNGGRKPRRFTRVAA